MDNILTLTPVKTVHNAEIFLPEETIAFTSRSASEIITKSPFIEANTESIGFSHLKEKYVIPVLAKTTRLHLVIKNL